MPLFVDNGSSPVDGITTNEHAVLNHTGVPGVAGSTLGGTGALGDVTILAGATTVNGVRNYNNLTIDPGATVTHDPARAMHIKCVGFFLNNGTIDVDGKGLPGNLSTTTGDVALGDQIAASAAFQGGCSASGGDGGGSGAGIRGGAGCRRAGMFGGGRTSPQLAIDPYPPGGGPRPPWVTDVEPVLPLAAPGGGGGAGTRGGGVTSLCGVGGDGGGCVIIEAQGAVTEGTITAVGAPGGGASPVSGGAGGGGGGAGGMVLVLHKGTLTTGAVSLGGGTFGAGVSGGIPGEPGEAGLLRRIQIP